MIARCCRWVSAPFALRAVLIVFFFCLCVCRYREGLVLNVLLRSESLIMRCHVHVESFCFGLVAHQFKVRRMTSLPLLALSLHR
jgi:hypothetical protein